MKLDAIPTVVRAARGTRVVVDFAPKPTSAERVSAGVITKLDTGEVSFTCAIDGEKAEHAFGEAGVAFYSIAYQLCESVAAHWRIHQDLAKWVPPFEGAGLADHSRFSARSAIDAQDLMLKRISSLHTLLSSYKIVKKQSNTGIVERVRSAVSRDINAKHLASRFNRQLDLGADAQPLKVDFLGQNFACYFLQLTRSERGLEASTDRAYGKLYELQALQRFIKKPPQNIGLFEDERPRRFELVMVGNREDPVQRRAIYQVEALADKGQVVARTLASPEVAAEHVEKFERKAA